MTDIKYYTVENCQNMTIFIIKENILKVNVENRIKDTMVFMIKGSTVTEIQNVKEEFQGVIDEFFELCAVYPEGEEILKKIL